MKKRFLAILLASALLFALLPQTVLYSNASNAYTINGVTVHWDDFSSSPSECWAYANNVYKKIWGHNFTNSFSDSENSLRNLSDSQLTLTAAHLKEYVSNAKLGSCLRICDSEYLHGSDGWGHSQIIVQKDANGFTVFEGGLSASPYCREKYYTWSAYADSSWPGGYAYIKYIKWPGAPAYSGGGSSNPGTPTDDSLSLYSYNYPTSLDVGKSFSIYGTVSSGYSNITSLTVGVYNTSGSMETGKTVYPNSKTYSISNVDAYVVFGSLPAGTHYYRITATNASGTKQLLNKSFSVVGAPVVGVVKMVDCYRTVTLPAKVINLYTNPTDTSRTTYFDKATPITVGCPTYAELSDGTIMYKVYTTHQGVKDTPFWFKYDSSMSVSAVHTYGSALYEYEHPHRQYQVCACGHVSYSSNYGSRDDCPSCYPASISASTTSVSLDLSSTPTRTVTITAKGNLPSTYAVRYEIDDSSVVSCAWGGWDGNTDPLKLTARSRGSTSVTVKLLDKENNDNVLDQLTISVKVTSPSYTISYNANGGTGAPSSQTKYYNEDLTLSSAQPTRNGYTFLGWATSSSAASASYYPGGLYTNNGSVTLYAVWKSATDGKCGDNLYWNFDQTNGTLLISGSGPMYDYSCAAPWEPFNEQILSIVVLDGCTNIGNLAFQNCVNATDISLADSIVRIGENAFWCCESIKAINLPANLETIEYQAFALCSMPDEITIPENVSYIGYYAFYNCLGLQTVVFDDCEAYIEESAFAGCLDLSFADFGSKLTGIGNEAFWLCNLSSVFIPASVSYIGTLPFDCCEGLYEINVADGNEWYCSIDGILYDKAVMTLIECPAAKAGDCTIPASVSSIENGAFFACMGLENIYFEGDAPAIGDVGFDYGYWNEEGGNPTFIYEPIPGLTLYYYEWTEGWSSPYWNGYPAVGIAHNYTYKVTTAPTATSAGTLTGACEDCGATTTVTVPKLNTTDYSYNVIQEPSCTATGQGRYTWNNTEYGYFCFDVMIPKNAHTSMTVVTAPTCTEKGYTTNICTVCGTSQVTDYTNPLGHHFEAGICTRCGESAAQVDPCEGYTDINRSGWYHSAADFVIARGLMGSTKTNALTFEPNTKVSRAMVASILYTMAGKPAASYKGTFTDVPAGKWFTNAIEWCAQNGLASGKGNGKFDPNGNVTRQELAVFMMQMAAYLGKDTSGRADLSGFADCAKVPAWSKTYVAWAVDAGLISGKASGDKTNLAPTDNATRAELAVIIRNFVQNIAEAD